MNEKLIKQINEKAFNVNNTYSMVEKDSNSYLLKTIENNKIKFYQYTDINNNKIKVNVYDSIKDNQDLRRAAEFICEFNVNEILININKKTFENNGSLFEEKDIILK